MVETRGKGGPKRGFREEEKRFADPRISPSVLPFKRLALQRAGCGRVLEHAGCVRV